MRRLAFIVFILIVIGVSLIALSACGRKPCHVKGSVRGEKGKLYYCDDKGSGLYWYPQSITMPTPTPYPTASYVNGIPIYDH